MCTCRWFPLTALHSGTGLMCWVAALKTQPLYLLTAYVALHAGAGLVCCVVGCIVGCAAMRSAAAHC